MPAALGTGAAAARSPTRCGTSSRLTAASASRRHWRTARPTSGAALRPLVPELDDLFPARAGAGRGEWWRRLLSAVGAVLSALAASRPIAILLEDLHWADATTLDLVEHLLRRDPPLPVVVTYRQGDPVTSRDRRLAGADPAPPGGDHPQARPTHPRRERRADGPPRRDRNAERGGPDASALGRVASVRRAARAVGGPCDVAEPLADLLDRRLAGISSEEWVIARALGVGDRPLTAAELRAVTDLTPYALTAGLRALDGRHLTRTGEHDVGLRHPLFAEAARRRLVAGEASDAHRRLALALAEERDAASAEVAEHWRRAVEPANEIAWRIRAARDARYPVRRGAGGRALATRARALAGRCRRSRDAGVAQGRRVRLRARSPGAHRLAGSGGGRGRGPRVVDRVSGVSPQPRCTNVPGSSVGSWAILPPGWLSWTVPSTYSTLSDILLNAHVPCSIASTCCRDSISSTRRRLPASSPASSSRTRTRSPPVRPSSGKRCTPRSPAG